MGIIAAYRGDFAGDRIEDLLRSCKRTQIQHGEGWALGIASDGGETAYFAADGNSEATVRLGDPQESGCAIHFSLQPQTVSIALSRDPFGCQAIYRAARLEGRYGMASWFCSDPRRLPRQRDREPLVNEKALHGYLCFSYNPCYETFFGGVESLAPPADLSAPGEGDPVPGSDGCPDELTLLTLLRQAVVRRLTPGARVGVYLSGGLDSSLVAALMVEAGVRPELFTLDFGPPYDQELPIARKVAAHLGLPLRVVSASPAQIARALPATARALPQPFGDAVTVPLYLLGEAAKDFVEEVWNGEGGDQLFGGWTNKPMIAAHLYDLADPEGGAERDEVAEYLATFHRFWGLTGYLYTPLQHQRVGEVDAGQWVRPALDQAAYPALLHRLRAANLRLKGAQNIAPRMVALAECHGLRVRAPFFDTALTAWTFTLPPERLLAGAREKFLLKQVAEQFLPGEVVWREKRGMGVPVSDWCLAWWRPSRWPVQQLLRHYLGERRLRAEGRFNPDFVRRLLGGEDPTPEGAFRKRRVGEKLWLLLMWEVWREMHGIV